MAGSLSYAPRCDVEPLLDEVLTESSSATDLEQPPSALRSCACGYAAIVAATLVSGCLLAGAAKQFKGSLLSKTMNTTAFADASMDGTHKIVSKSSGKCLDWGQVIIGLTECDAANLKEMWTYTDSHLEAPTGQCLDMGGKEVHVWKCDMNAGDAIESNQHWKFDEETGEIRHHAKENVCLTASGAGTKVSMEACDKGSHDQRWHVHVHTLPKPAEKEHDKQPTEQEAATEETLEHAGTNERPAPAEKVRPAPAAAPSMAPNGKAPEPREAASSAPGSEAADSETAAPQAAESARDWVVSITLGCLLLAFFAWKKRSAKKQQSRAVKVQGDEKDIEAAEAVPAAEAADAEPAEQPGQQPEETPKPEEEAPAETAGGSPAEEAAAGGDEEAAAQEAGSAEAAEATEGGGGNPFEEEAAQEAGGAEAAEAAEGGGGNPFEEEAAQEEAAEHTAEAGALEDVPAPQEAGEAAAEAAEAAPATAEAAGALAEADAPAEAAEAPAEAAGAPAAGEAQPGEADEEDAALQEALRRSMEEQEQPPAQEELQEQAAPEAAQAAPKEPEQPAPAPPKKSGKKCVVM